ncbi:two-component system sensor histidine kinase NtrB [Salipaludibacillus sp. CF4.18]|uniref:two-component system sensor histidine kinase NtrB n=1 Tax=Salipaludibacillus sp. CF4.18 TaxID=3373081 RepID=UPI003EE6A5C4
MSKKIRLNDTISIEKILKDNLRLEAVLNALPVGVFIIDKNGEFTHMNDIVYEIWGINATSAKDVSEYKNYIGWWIDSGKQITKDEWAAARALKGEYSYGEIIKIKSFDGEIKTILNSSSPIYDLEGKINGAVVVNSDITELKEMEQELQNHKNYLTELVNKRTLELENLNEELKLKIKEQDRLQKQIRHLDQLNLVGQMAAGLGHEVRNPMTTVKGFIQIFQSNKEFEHYKDTFNLMISEIDRVDEIISEFLSLSKNKRADKKEYCLNNLILTVAPLINSDLILENKNLQLNLHPNIPLLLLDKNEIKQLSLNFARNGIEAMTEGETLSISTHYKDKHIILAFQDEGTGIKEELLEHIYKPFFTTKPQGTGLGLPICYSIAQRHNADIECESSATGTIFYVKFKLNT